MIIRAAIIIIVGIIQVVVGAIILLKSAGFMTHVGSGLISEGISDIIFGASGGDWVILTFGDYIGPKKITEISSLSVK